MLFYLLINIQNNFYINGPIMMPHILTFRENAWHHSFAFKALSLLTFTAAES